MTARGAFISDDLLEYKPIPGQEENPTLDELMAINPDVVGWLTVDDTHIDYPVVQGENDMEYINKDVYGEFALPGSIFLSCVNSGISPTRTALCTGITWQMAPCLGILSSLSIKTILIRIPRAHCIFRMRHRGLPSLPACRLPPQTR